MADYYSFYSSFIPCTAHLSEHKINEDEVLLTLASELGQVEVRSLAASDPGRVVVSIRVAYSPREFG